jgi:hypothetical protein
MWYEVKVVCRFCGRAFRAAVEADTPPTSDRLFRVRCPENTSDFLFRVVENHSPGWDGSWVYQAGEWYSAGQLPPKCPSARPA